MEKIKFLITKLPILSLVLISAIVLRLAGAGLSIISASYDYKHPIYTSVFSKISGETTLHGNTKVAAKKNKDKKETYTKSKESKKSKEKKHVELDGDSLPKKTSRPVVSAVDYGIANPDYLDEEGTTYDYINDGMFAFHDEMRTFESVENDYFNDALFIGDSRTDGLCRYGGAGEVANFFALESVTIYNVFDIEIPYHKFDSDEEETTNLEQVLVDNKFKKIYLAPGLNELGVPDTSSFRQEYINVIERIRELQPDAIIYIEGIIHVNYDRSTSDEVYNNKIIVQRNEAISKLANGYDIFYIDPNEALCDKDGNLKYEYTNDGVHLTATYYSLWHMYLKQFAIVVD